MAFFWFNAGDPVRPWVVRTDAGIEFSCREVIAAGRTIVDGKKRRLPTNHAFEFDEKEGSLVDAQLKPDRLSKGKVVSHGRRK